MAPRRTNTALNTDVQVYMYFLTPGMTNPIDLAA